jgi:hypothetical protein
LDFQFAAKRSQVNFRAYIKTKKADVAEHPEVFDHAGLLVDEPSSYAGVLFIQSSDNHAPIRSHSPVIR